MVNMQSLFPINILHVDDEPRVLETCKAALEKDGKFTVHVTRDPDEAIAILEKNGIDVIISAYQLPGMNGIELLRKIRSSGGNTPFIVFTGKGDEDVVLNAFESGADFYIRKGKDISLQLPELMSKMILAHRRRLSEDAVSKQIEALESSIEGTAIIDPHQNHIVVNKAYAKMFGYDDPEDLKGISWKHLYSEDDIEAYGSELTESLDGIGHFRGKVLGRRKDGSSFLVEISVLKLKDSHYNMSVREVTPSVDMERERMLVRLNTLRIFNSVREMVFITDCGRHVAKANKVATERLGYPEESIVGSDMCDLHPSEMRDRIIEAFDSTTEWEGTMHNIPFIDSEGKEIEAETSISKGSLRGDIVFICVSRLDAHAKLEHQTATQDEL